MAKPFVKWAGGKGKLLPQIVQEMPRKYNRYIEPFLGGGSVFFHISPEEAVLADINQNLINCYIQMRDNPGYLADELSKIEKEFNSLKEIKKADYYYAKREEYNSHAKSNQYAIYVSALFLFLNKACFNGLYRENKKGLFNTPFGKKKTLNLCDTENIQAVSECLQGKEILCCDFEDLFTYIDAKEGDFVFFDSPYAGTYGGYHADGFAEKDHERLKNLLDKLSYKGVNCMLTNNDCAYVRELYNWYWIKSLDTFQSMNRVGNKREAKELIIKNYNYSL